MMGEAVTLWEPCAGEADDFGNAAQGWTAHEVENCLVRSTDGGTDTDNGRRETTAQYAVALPKGAFDGYPTFRDWRVSLTKRGLYAGADAALRVVGEPSITEPCPTAWNVTLQCEVAHG